MSETHRRSHAAHPNRNGVDGKEGYPPEELPSHLLHTESDQIRELLEALDDAIFDAIQGDEKALEQAKSLWPRAVKEIEWHLVEESRENYLRYAVDVSRRCEQHGNRSPEHALLAVEIISLLAKY